MNHWQFIHAKISQKKAVYLLVVIQHKGSSPGRQGFKMVVADDEIFGSIGGGVMEFNLVELCKGLLQQQKLKSFIKHQVHKGAIVDGSGMICSGEQTVIFFPLQYDNLDLISTIKSTVDTNKSGLLTITSTSISFSTQESSETKYRYTFENETNWSYQEQLNKKDTLYIVGGGHVGLATAKLFRDLGFYIVVYDNRANLNTFENNTFAHEKKIVSYDAIAAHIQETDSGYVVIMTNTYKDDKLVLSKLVSKHFKFIGVLGSQAKLKVLFEVLKKEGFKEHELQRVHAPVGLHIHSQTPEEIAVSIAAQIISVKNQH